MADELHTPDHRWYEPRNHIPLAKEDVSKQWIFDSGIQKIDAWINSQPWGNQILPLFANGEQGAWYDPSDLTTLFTDTTGTTPATVGSAVALMLDKSKGAGYAGGTFTGLGSELVSNGTFDVDTAGWTQVGTGSFVWDASGAIACSDVAGGDCNAQTNITTVAGRRYVFRWTVVSVTGGGQWLARIRNGADFVQTGIGTTGSFQVTFVASVTGTNTVHLLSATTNQTVVFDNISVRELPGNHATQSVLAQRPILSRVPATGRRNLLTYTEQFDNAIWQKNNLTISANSSIAPDGTLTADTVTGTGSGGSFLRNLNSYPTGATVRVSVYLKAGTSTSAAIGDVNAGITLGVFNLSNGTITSGATAQIVDAGSGWYRCSVSFIPVNPGSWFFNPGTVGAAVTTESILAWGAQLEVGSTATAYQRVVTARDVTEAGVADLHYLFCDGLDDGMVTSAIDFTATDKVTVFTGVRKLSDAPTGMLLEFGPQVFGNIGTFSHLLPDTSLATSLGLDLRGNGTSGIQRIATGAAPNTFVSSVVFDLAGTTFDTERPVKRINGANVASGSNAGSTDTGGGNFSTQILYLFRRAGSSLPFSGHFYGGIILGRTATAAEITNTERYMAQKTGVTLA